MRRRVRASVVVATLLAAACGFAHAQNATPKQLRVVVSIAPQAYLVERVAGTNVETEVLVGSGQSPHTYEATAKQMVRMSESAVYFRIGVDFERALVPRIERMLPQLKIVDLRRGITLRKMEDGAACLHEDGEHDHASHASGAHEPDEQTPDAHEAHGHASDAPTTSAPSTPTSAPAETLEGYDPHSWLNPRLAKIMAQTIADTLIQLDPPHADAYRRNLAAFQAELDDVRAEIARALAPMKGQRVFVFHPAFGYFLDEFGLTQVPVEAEGKQPTPRQLVKLIDAAKAEKVRVIFVQPQFSRKSADIVAHAIGGAVEPLDPLAQDYIANLRRITQALQAGLGNGAPR